MNGFDSPPIAAAATPPQPSSLPATSTPPRPRSSRVYDLFLTAVGRTPRGADAFSPGSQAVAVTAEEEEFWTAIESDDTGGDAEAPSAPAGPTQQAGPHNGARICQPATTAAAVGGGASSVAVGGEGAGYVVPRQMSAAGMGRVDAEAAGGGGASPGMRGAGTRSRSASRALQLSPAEAARYPSGDLDSLAAQEGEDGGRGNAGPIAGSARRRGRMFRSVVAASETDSTNPSSRQSPASRFTARGNPLFRTVNGSSFWPGRPRNAGGGGGGAMNGTARTLDRNGDRSGASAVERAVNGAAPSGSGSAAATGVGGSLDASEAGGSGRILFYHKPTLANVPAGDVPDAVPVYLGCPGGGMALGLPLNDAWQGGEHQDTTFDQNLSYTILSWPEDHVKDLLELWRLQVLFFTTMIFNVLVAALLFFADNPDRTRVEGPARPGAFPGPFQQRSISDEPTGVRSEDWHMVAALLLGLVGMVCVMSRSRAGVSLYLSLAVLNAIVGLANAPDAVYACRFAIDLVLVAMGRSYLASLTYSWVTASAGDGRRGW